MIVDGRGREVLGGGGVLPVDIASLSSELRRLWEEASEPDGAAVTRACARNLIALCAAGAGEEAAGAALVAVGTEHPAARGLAPEQFLLDAFIDKCVEAVNMKRALPWPEPAIHGDTIWMGTADSAGRMVSYIQSVYWEFGSGVVLQDTGVVWQNRGSSFSLDAASHLALAPGKKTFHTLIPAYAHLDDGRRMIYGNMGGDGQPQSQSAVFSRYAMFGMPLQEAVSAPRWLLGKTWGQESTTLKFENRFDPDVLKALAAAGHQVEVLGDYSDSMGHAGAIVRQTDGLYLGAADPRSDGVIAAY